MKKYTIFSRRNFLKNSSLGLGMGLMGFGCGGGQNEMMKNSESFYSEGPIPDKLLKNAKIVLEVSCRAKTGETLLILADSVLLPYAPVLSSAAVEMGLIPLIFDIRDYLSSPAYAKGFVLPPLKAAMESADIVIENLADTWVPNRPDYGRLTGNPDMQDAALSSERRWLIIQPKGMEKWEISPEKVASIRKRTLWLMDKLKSAKTGRITSARGTDFTFGLGNDAGFNPILGIVPLYGEVAVVPDLKTTSGTFIVDGPTQLDVRPSSELDREPFSIYVEAGRLKEIKGGDPVQLQRLKKFIASGDPAADAIDEVGILTTPFVENDIYYWSDGTHHHDRVHIALGNNVRRDTLVHGPKHMDCEVIKPTINIDGLVIIENGEFLDRVMEDVMT